MSTFEWQDVLMDEEEGLPLDPVKEDLPDENEKEGEDNGFDSEASGALSEDDDPEGMKDVPTGEDPFTGEKSSEFDNVLLNCFSDKEESEKEEKGEDEEEEKSEGEGENADEPEDEKEEKGETDHFYHDSFFTDEENGLPLDPVKEDLPSENEKEGEDNGQDSEAAGALSEDDDPKGMDDVPFGEDPFTGTKSTEYDDTMTSLLNSFRDEEKSDDEEEKSEGDEEEKGDDNGDDKGSNDDGASKKGDTEGEGEKKSEEDEAYVDDFQDFFVDADTVVPEGPEGSKLEPADPVDGNGDDVCPIGDPDLPSNLTEPVVVPSDDPHAGPLENQFREDVRFSFGDF